MVPCGGLRSWNCTSYPPSSSAVLPNFRGRVLDDKPRYHIALRQVHTQRRTQIYSTHINTCVLRQNRGPKARSASAGPAGFWCPVHMSTLWANGQTERVNDIMLERGSESICCLRSLLIGMYAATELRARGERVLRLD